MSTRTLTFGGITMVAVVALAVLGTWRLASAIGPDVNNDGIVSGGDIAETVQAFGQRVPTPMPTPTPEPSSLARGVVLTAGQQADFGAFDPAVCREPTVYVAATRQVDQVGLEANRGFHIYVRADQDGLPDPGPLDRNDPSLLFLGRSKASAVAGEWSIWSVQRGTSLLSGLSGKPITPTVLTQLDVPWPAAPYTMIGVDMEAVENDTLQFTAEVHCASLLP